MISKLGLAALLYVEKFGFSVFPCIPKDKKPLTMHGCLDATTSSEQIRLWWERWPDANIGIACGTASNGLLVLDIDGDDGRDTLRSLERKHGPLPHTPQVLTPNGEHYYFGSSDKFKNQVKFAPGLDIRSSGGYVLGPPSIQKSGKVYVWDIARRIDETPIAMPPAWLVELLSKSTEKNNVRRDWKTVPFANTPIGSRNQTLVSLTGHLLRKHVDEQIAYTLLLAWNKCCTQEPLPIEEFEKTVNGIAKMEFERRKSEGRL